MRNGKVISLSLYVHRYRTENGWKADGIASRDDANFNSIPFPISVGIKIELDLDSLIPRIMMCHLRSGFMPVPFTPCHPRSFIFLFPLAVPLTIKYRNGNTRIIFSGRIYRNPFGKYTGIIKLASFRGFVSWYIEQLKEHYSFSHKVLRNILAYTKVRRVVRDFVYYQSFVFSENINGIFR